MAKPVGFVITAGHLDIEWYQPLRSYRFWTMQVFDDLKRIGRERPDFVNYVLDGQVFPLEEYLEVAPQDEQAVRELIAKGILTIGPFYTQFDEWLPSAEAMMRNCLYGLRRAERYGAPMRAGYLPDNFGHPLQLPQILNGFGIDSLLFMRGMPEFPQEHPDEFLYRGLDGSQVLASHFRESYGGAFNLFDKAVDPIQPREVPYYSDYLGFEWHRELAWHEDPAGIARNMIDNVRAIVQRYPSGVVPLISGYDHLSPQFNLGESVRLANDLQDEIEFVWGTPQQYIELARRRMGEPWMLDEELIGSRYQYVLFGALSTRTYLKRQQFAGEALLERYAEPLGAIAAAHGAPAAQTLMDEAWRNLMINSAHDSIHGSSLDEVHVEMEARYAAARQIAAGLIHNALAHLASRLRLGRAPAGGQVLVWAPAGAGHPQACEFWAAIGDRCVVVTDMQGRALPTQVLPREPIERNALGQPRHEPFPLEPYRKVLFLNTFGQGDLKSYALVDAGQPSCLPAQQGVLENQFLRVEAAGAMLHVLDKRTGRWHRCLNLLEEEADAGDAWDFSPPWVPGEIVRSTQSAFACTMLENGPVRWSMRLQGVMDVPEHLEGDLRSPQRANMAVTFDVALYAGVPRVDVALTLHNTARDHRVRLRVPFGVRSPVVKSQGHLAIIERGLARPTEREHWWQPPTRLLPFREWIAVDDGCHGLAVSFQGVYDYEAEALPLNGETEIAFTLVRGIGRMGRVHTLQREGGASWSHPTPGAQCLGEHVIKWSYIPYQADAGDKAPFRATAESFLYPPAAHVVRRQADPEAAPDEIITPVRWPGNHICFSAFKAALDGPGFIARAYENQGRETTVDVPVSGFTHVYLANLNEQPLARLALVEDHVHVTFRPYRCVTLLLSNEELPLAEDPNALL